MVRSFGRCVSERAGATSKLTAARAGDGKISRELTPGKPEVSVFTTYEVTVVTADVYGGGTNANVFMTAYGSKGKSDKVDLKSKTATFERGSVEKFTFTEKDLGDLEKIIIGHDNSGAGAAWMCTQVLIRSVRTNDIYVRRAAARARRRLTRSLRAALPVLAVVRQEQWRHEDVRRVAVVALCRCVDVCVLSVRLCSIRELPVAKN